MNSGAVFGKYKNIFLFVLYLEVELLGDGGVGGLHMCSLGQYSFPKWLSVFAFS